MSSPLASASPVTPAVLLPLLPRHSPLRPRIEALSPLTIAWEQLASVNGWLVSLGRSPGLQGGAPLPVSDPHLWDNPDQAVAAAAAVALSYAHQRGADWPPAARQLLLRESPVAVVVPAAPRAGLSPSLAALAGIGVPLVEEARDDGPDAPSITPFAARASAHRSDLGQRHDPVFSFLPKPAEHLVTIGDNALSSFVVHAEGERDGVTVIGEPSERIGIEIGVAQPGLTIRETAKIEQDAATIPSFLEFALAAFNGSQLSISWDAKHPVSPPVLGELFWVWLKALWGIPLVDVRIAFAPSHGRSALLVDMRARAQQYRAIRATSLEENTER